MVMVDFAVCLPVLVDVEAVVVGLEGLGVVAKVQCCRGMNWAGLETPSRTLDQAFRY